MSYRIAEIHRVEEVQQETVPQWKATLADLNDDTGFYIVVVLSNHGENEASATVARSSSGRMENQLMVLALSDGNRPLSEWREGDLLEQIL